MMVSNIKDYVTLDPDDVDADFRYKYRYTMIALFKQDLFNKNFRLQDQGKCGQIETLQNRIKFRLIIIDMGVQYLIIFLFMIISTMDWIILFAVQR